MRTVLIDDVLLISLIDDFLDPDDEVSSLMLILLCHFVDLHQDLMFPLLTDGIPTFFVLIYVLFAGLNGPDFGLYSAVFDPLG